MYKFDYYVNPRALIHRLEYYLCRNNEASINLTLVPLLSNKFYCESISILFAASDSCIDRQSAIFFFLFSSSNNEKKKKKYLVSQKKTRQYLRVFTRNKASIRFVHYFHTVVEVGLPSDSVLNRFLLSILSLIVIVPGFIGS